MNTSTWWDGFWSVALKEVTHIRRDPASLVFAMLIPALQIIIFGFAIDFDVRHIKTAVVDQDRSRESRAYLDKLKNTQYLQVTEMMADTELALAQVRKGNVRVVVIIPPDFSRAGQGQPNPSVQVLIDGSDSQVAARIVAAFRPPSAPVAGAVQPHLQLLYNPEARTSTFTIPGLIGIILQLVTVSLTSLSMVKEREQGTLEQVMVSPVSRLGLMLGKIVPYAFLGMAEMVAVLWLGWLVFDVRPVGSLLQLALMTVPFLLASLGLGLAISTLSQNQGQAVQLMLFTLLPSVLLSGFVFPRESMPGPLYAASHLLPVTYYVEILRGVIIRGATLSDLWLPTAILWVIATVLILFSANRFHKSLA